MGSIWGLKEKGLIREIAYSQSQTTRGVIDSFLDLLPILCGVNIQQIYNSHNKYQSIMGGGVLKERMAFLKFCLCRKVFIGGTLMERGAKDSFHGTLRDRMRDQLSFRKALCKQLSAHIQFNICIIWKDT